MVRYVRSRTLETCAKIELLARNLRPAEKRKKLPILKIVTRKKRSGTYLYNYYLREERIHLIT